MFIVTFESLININGTIPELFHMYFYGVVCRHMPKRYYRAFCDVWQTIEHLVVLKSRLS